MEAMNEILWKSTILWFYDIRKHLNHKMDYSFPQCTITASYDIADIKNI